MSGPRSVHRPEFTPEPLAEAHRIVHQHNAAHQQVLRASLALLVVTEPGLTHAEAGRRCGLDRETVYKWRRRWAKHGWSLCDAPRSGRPRVFSPSGGDDGEVSGL